MKLTISLIKWGIENCKTTEYWNSNNKKICQILGILWHLVVCRECTYNKRITMLDTYGKVKTSFIFPDELWTNKQ